MGPMDHHLWHVLLWEWSEDRQLHQNSFSPRIQRLVLPSIVPLQRQVGYLDLHDWNKSIQTPTINFLFIYRRDFGRCISFFLDLVNNCKELKFTAPFPSWSYPADLLVARISISSPSNPGMGTGSMYRPVQIPDVRDVCRWPLTVIVVLKLSLPNCWPDCCLDAVCSTVSFAWFSLDHPDCQSEQNQIFYLTSISGAARKIAKEWNWLYETCWPGWSASYRCSISTFIFMKPSVPQVLFGGIQLKVITIQV